MKTKWSLIDSIMVGVGIASLIFLVYVLVLSVTGALSA